MCISAWRLFHDNVLSFLPSSFNKYFYFPLSLLFLPLSLILSSSFSPFFFPFSPFSSFIFPRFFLTYSFSFPLLFLNPFSPGFLPFSIFSQFLSLLSHLSPGLLWGVGEIWFWGAGGGVKGGYSFLFSFSFLIVPLFPLSHSPFSPFLSVLFSFSYFFFLIVPLSSPSYSPLFSFILDTFFPFLLFLIPLVYLFISQEIKKKNIFTFLHFYIFTLKNYLIFISFFS